MNATSSRAHTIITIHFKQCQVEDGRPVEKQSVINLVDLAGSEKAGQTGATGSRLKEGCAINKSLTVLGQCISTLADKAMGKAKKEVVPFRESALTRILQTALGGNSKTIMICALSPSFMNYEETLSTLRYADRAKKIVNKATVNESVQDRIIRELKEENKKLKEMLKKLATGGATVNLAEAGLGDMKSIIESMDVNEAIVEDMQKPFAEKLAEAKEKDAAKQEEIAEKVMPRKSFVGKPPGLTEEIKEKEAVTPEKDKHGLDLLSADDGVPRVEEESGSFHNVRQSISNKKKKAGKRDTHDKSVPHLTNLHEDPMLSGIVYYPLSCGEIHIGRKTGNPPPEIILGAVGIKPNHASIKILPNGLYELKVCDADAAASTMVNGKNLPSKKKSKVLNHCDRICFNGSIMYAFKYPVLKKAIDKKVEENKEENQGVDMHLQRLQAWELI